MIRSEEEVLHNLNQQQRFSDLDQLRRLSKKNQHELNLLLKLSDVDQQLFIRWAELNDSGWETYVERGGGSILIQVEHGVELVRSNLRLNDIDQQQRWGDPDQQEGWVMYIHGN